MAKGLAPSANIPQRLQRIARDVHDLAFDYMEVPASHAEAAGRDARVEDLAAELRAVVRG